MTTNADATTIDEIGDGIYRIHTIVAPPSLSDGFSFNQYLVVDDEPLLFHTGSRLLFPRVKEALARVIPPSRLRYVAFSHWEQDECGALNSFLELAPAAVPLCSGINAMINAEGMDRPPRVLADGERISLGKHRLRWFDVPHVPHGWESGLLLDETERTLFCGDLFTQPGRCVAPIVESDILAPSEALRRGGLDYFAHGPDLSQQLERLASTDPRVLACMHGHAWRGDGAKLLRLLERSIAEDQLLRLADRRRVPRLQEEEQRHE